MVTSRTRHLAQLIEDMMSHIHRRSADDTLAVMNDAGLTMAQMVALMILEKLGPLSVSSVAACTKLSPAAASHMVDRLVIAGFAGRTEDPSDRRAKRIAITDSGRGLIQRSREQRTHEFTRILARLSREVQSQFGRALARVVEELQNLPDREEVRRAMGKEIERREAQEADARDSKEAKKTEKRKREETT
jgi:DNA-binding MarR family transcriptional regulator